MGSIITISTKSYLLFSIVLFCGVTSQVLYKLGAQKYLTDYESSFIVVLKMFLSPYVVCGVFLQIITLGATLLVLRNVQLLWFGLMAALFPLLLSIAGVFVFNEKFTSMTVIGGIFIIIGIICVNCK